MYALSLEKIQSRLGLHRSGKPEGVGVRASPRSEDQPIDSIAQGLEHLGFHVRIDASCQSSTPCGYAAATRWQFFWIARWREVTSLKPMKGLGWAEMAA